MVKARFSYFDNKKGEVSVFDRQKQRVVAGMFQVTRNKLWYVYSFPSAKPLLLNSNSPEKTKSGAMKKLKAFIKRKYK
jgi:hypothetical protein